jgi:hypothetical protein
MGKRSNRSSLVAGDEVVVVETDPEVLKRVRVTVPGKASQTPRAGAKREPKPDSPVKKKVARMRRERTGTIAGHGFKAQDKTGPQKLRDAKRGTDGNDIYLSGTAPQVFNIDAKLSNIIGFCQMVAMELVKYRPEIVTATTSLDAKLKFSDLVFYNFACILYGHARVDGCFISNNFPSIIRAFPDDFTVLGPIAVFIQHYVEVIGVPNVRHVLKYETDLVATTSCMTGGTVTDVNSVSQNQLGVETGGQWIEGHNYTYNFTLNDYKVNDPAYTFNFCSGANNWLQSRFSVVQETLKGITGICKVNMSEVPRNTRDYSGFVATSGGRTWVEAGLAYGPSPRFNIGLAIALQPNGCNVQVPAFGYVRPIPPPTSQVSGGDYGNTFGGSGAYWGQPVVPISLTIVMDCLQKMIKLSLLSPAFKPVFFGKKGFRWGGLIVHNFTDIICLPVDIFGLVAKMMNIYIRSGEEKNSAPVLLPKSALISLPQILQGMLLRKIWDTNFDTYFAFSPNYPTPSWLIQSVVPCRDYLAGQLPIPLATVINAIGPVAIRGSGKNPKKNNKIAVPVAGNYQMTEAWSAGGPTKYTKVPKFGCLPQSGYQVSADEAPLNWYFTSNSSTTTSVGINATCYPFFMGAPGGVWAGTQPSVPVVLGSSQLFSGGVKIECSEFVYDPSSTAPEAYDTYFAWGGAAVVTVDAALETAYINNYSASSNKETSMLVQSAFVGDHIQWLTEYYKNAISTSCDAVAYASNCGPGLLSMAAPAVAAPTKGSSLYAGWFTADSIIDGVVNCVVGNGVITTIPWSYRKLLSMTFLTDVRIFMASIFNPVAVYVTSVEQAQLGQLNSFSQMPYTATLPATNSTQYWNDFVLDCITEGGMINARLKKVEGKAKSQSRVDAAFATHPPVSNDRTLDILDAFLAYVIANSQASGIVTSFELGDLDKSMELYKATGKMTNELAVMSDVVSDTQSNESIDDANMGNLKQFGHGVVKGLTTVIPHAIKLAGELLPLL